jgi:hypothetical protein
MTTTPDYSNRAPWPLTVDDVGDDAWAVQDSVERLVFGKRDELFGEFPSTGTLVEKLAHIDAVISFDLQLVEVLKDTIREIESTVQLGQMAADANAGTSHSWYGPDDTYDRKDRDQGVGFTTDDMKSVFRYTMDHKDDAS